MGRPKGRTSSSVNAINEVLENDEDLNDTLNADPEIEDAEPCMLEPGLELKIQTYLDTYNREQAPVHVHLSKFDNPLSGNARSVCGTYENEIPSIDKVGKTLGSGRYLIMIWTPKKGNQKPLVKGITFRVHPIYDELKKEEEEKKRASTFTAISSLPIAPPRENMPAPSNNSAESLTVMLAVFEKFMGVLAPILNRPAQPENQFQGMLQTYQMTEAILKNQLKDSAKFVNDLRRQKLLGEERPPMNMVDNDIEDYPPEPPAKKSLFEELIPVLTQWLPVLMKNGPVAQATAATVQAIPQVRTTIAELNSQPDELKKLINELEKNPKIGKKGVDTALGKLGIKRP